MMNIIIRMLIAGLLSATVCACAFDVVKVKRSPVVLDITDQVKTGFVLLEEADVKLDTGYHRKLKKDTAWQYVGTVPAGDVFKTTDQVLTVEGSNVFEAYIVANDGKLVGFYLPVEKAYTALGRIVELKYRNL